MIPKVIHYCWFGRSQLPKSAIRCIASWKTYLPDYEIKEWNEDNFDVNIIPYTQDAYAAKKYAFVSDYARFWILYYYGGIYFDTDVEVIKPMDNLIGKGAFMGWERPNMQGIQSIAPGLGLAAPQRHPLYKEVLNSFERLDYYIENGERNTYSMIPMVTDILFQKGLRKDGGLQVINGITIYPSDYLCPMDPIKGNMCITNNTYTIHWYTMSWLPKLTQWRVKLMRIIRRIYKCIY